MSVKRITEPKVNNRYNNTAYCKTWIESNSNKLIRWTLKIDSFGTRKSVNRQVRTDGSIYIGVVSKDNRLNEDYANDDDKPYQYFRIRPYMMLVPGDQSGDKQLMIELDMKQKKVFRCIIGRESRTEYMVITGDKIDYKLAVSFTGNDGKISLIDFECVQQE